MTIRLPGAFAAASLALLLSGCLGLGGPTSSPGSQRSTITRLRESQPVT